MSLLVKIKKYNQSYLNLILALLPFSFIAGNMIININVILLILFSFAMFKSEIFKIKIFFLDKIIITFFCLLFLTAFINDFELYYLEKVYWRGFFPTTIKSILFIRYILIYFILRYLIEKKKINLRYFFISSALASLFVCIDVIFQFFNGKDIFGYEVNNSSRKLGGPFGDELIAGSFIQRFSLFSFFILPLFFKESSKKYSKYLIPILLIIFFIGMILSGNRMPLMLFIFATSLIGICENKIRKYFIPLVLISVTIFTLIYNSNEKVKNNFDSFYFKIYQAVNSIYFKETIYKKPQYLREFESFYDTWLMNKYIGGGIKNFRYYCHVRPNIDKNSKFICNMHPHNYYLEILTETGILGLILILLIFVNILYLSFYKKYFSSSIIRNNNLIIPFLFLFIAEIFPIKSTGSFFTTGNTTFLFLIIGFLVALVRKDNLIENHK